ncbi:8-amino-7-oxononanoate synthase [Dokdonella fugitiva]|jgi:8-amino-7-oxononanoate synthase|uniref:8-amino-7-oxononanoate synthase n=1 Tax=Dokdonella fugitiva TaxID=328517 RepID=A0A4R2IFA9_9GAMM|nr:8-amino-7-oxononanoate synthase [Dokdonella fugitiva]MBA8882660.1 8-amino-7-oxononanoate synthase [Dokdonella fugitiva]TCO43364.1 8-amino-7-oxononanoate synthase [Dokdonella fugitiva]
MRPDLLARLADAQAERARASLLRRLRTVDAVEGATIVVEGRRLLDFASNDYLGLAQHPALRETLARAAARWGVGAGAAHLLGGHRDEHAELEAALARWTGRERALLFSTGYMANLGVVAALLGAGDLCVQDKLDHASLIDAARLAGCTFKRYVHGDVASAARQLDTEPDAAALLATDGVFSMDGDIAPLRELARLARERQATLMVDDAHGLGVLGADGAGSVAEAGLSQDDVPVLMGTLGKALGVAGAFVAGSAALVDGLVQSARTFVYTTALPPALAAATRVAIDIARHEGWRRDHLRRLVTHFRTGAHARRIALLESRTPIQPVRVGDSAAALALSRQLAEAGFFVPAIRPPTVPKGEARLRVALSVRHAEGDVERLLDALASAGASLPADTAVPETPSTPAPLPRARARRGRGRKA